MTQPSDPRKSPAFANFLNIGGPLNNSEIVGNIVEDTHTFISAQSMTNTVIRGNSFNRASAAPQDPREWLRSIGVPDDVPVRDVVQALVRIATCGDPAKAQAVAADTALSRLANIASIVSAVQAFGPTLPAFLDRLLR